MGGPHKRPGTCCCLPVKVIDLDFDFNFDLYMCNKDTVQKESITVMQITDFEMKITNLKHVKLGKNSTQEALVFDLAIYVDAYPIAEIMGYRYKFGRLEGPARPTKEGGWARAGRVGVILYDHLLAKLVCCKLFHIGLKEGWLQEPVSAAEIGEYNSDPGWRHLGVEPELAEDDVIST